MNSEFFISTFSLVFFLLAISVFLNFSPSITLASTTTGCGEYWGGNWTILAGASCGVLNEQIAISKHLVLQSGSTLELNGTTNLIFGFNYRKPITISNSGTALSNYAINITVDTGSLITAIYELPISISSTGTALTDYQVNVTITNTTILGHMQSDGKDIRFFNQSTSSPYTATYGKLNYWIESISSSMLSVWVKVDSIPASGGKTIYMYYGNSSASAESDGVATFELFDNFDDNSFNTTKWVVKWGTAANVKEQNQVLNITYDTDQVDLCVQTNTFTQARPFILEYKLKPASQATGGTNWVVGLLYTGTSNSNQYRMIYYGTYGYGLYKDGTLIGGWQDGTADMSLGTEYNIKIVVNASTLKVFRDGTEKGSWTNDTYDNLKLGIGRENNLRDQFDNFRVRKYALSEPTTSIGTETEKSSGKMRSDCGDMRFGDSDYNGYPYWIEPGTCNSANTRIWVNVTTLPAGSKTIYMFYGNPAATSVSNGTEVFLFFDDFDSADTSKFNYSTAYCGYNPVSYSVSGSKLTIWSDSTWRILGAKTNTGPSGRNVTVVTKFNASAASGWNQSSFVQLDLCNQNRYGLQDNGALGWRAQMKDGTGYTYSGVITTLTANTWYIDEIRRNSTGCFRGRIFSSTWGLLGSHESCNSVWSGVTWTWVTWQYQATKVEFDWIFIRESVSREALEPTASVGSEESNLPQYIYISSGGKIYTYPPAGINKP